MPAQANIDNNGIGTAASLSKHATNQSYTQQRIMQSDTKLKYTVSIVTVAKAYNSDTNTLIKKILTYLKGIR